VTVKIILTHQLTDKFSFYTAKQIFTAQDLRVSQGKNQVEVFWIVIPCNVVVGYHCFRGPCCFHRQGEVEDIYCVCIWYRIEHKGQ